jgi:hypothetical protein
MESDYPFPYLQTLLSFLLRSTRYLRLEGYDPSRTGLSFKTDPNILNLSTIIWIKNKRLRKPKGESKRANTETREILGTRHTCKNTC